MPFARNEPHWLMVQQGLPWTLCWHLWCSVLNASIHGIQVTILLPALLQAFAALRTVLIRLLVSLTWPLVLLPGLHIPLIARSGPSPTVSAA